MRTIASKEGVACFQPPADPMEVALRHLFLRWEHGWESSSNPSERDCYYRSLFGSAGTTRLEGME